MQKFDFVLQDPAYELQLKQTLTIKPKNFFIRATPRAGKAYFFPVPAAGTLKAPTDTGKATSAAPSETSKPLYVLYGSNTGNSEAFAQRVASDAAAHGTYNYKLRLIIDIYSPDFRVPSHPRYT